VTQGHDTLQDTTTTAKHCTAKDTHVTPVMLSVGSHTCMTCSQCWGVNRIPLCCSSEETAPGLDLGSGCDVNTQGTPST
jgi:hypothetical protein